MASEQGQSSHDIRCIYKYDLTALSGSPAFPKDVCPVASQRRGIRGVSRLLRVLTTRWVKVGQGEFLGGARMQGGGG